MSKPAITCSKLTKETLEQGVKSAFTVNFEHISQPSSRVSIVNFEQINAGWDGINVSGVN